MRGKTARPAGFSGPGGFAPEVVAPAPVRHLAAQSATSGGLPVSAGGPPIAAIQCRWYESATPPHTLGQRRQPRSCAKPARVLILPQLGYEMAHHQEFVATPPPTC